MTGRRLAYHPDRAWFEARLETHVDDMAAELQCDPTYVYALALRVGFRLRRDRPRRLRRVTAPRECPCALQAQCRTGNRVACETADEWDALERAS